MPRESRRVALLRRCAHSMATTLLVLHMSACATFFGGGPSQAISVASDPPGALFAAVARCGDEAILGVTPQTLSLRRGARYRVQFVMPGYETRFDSLTKGISPVVWGDLATANLGIVIDVASGSAYTLNPRELRVSLVPQAMARVPDPLIVPPARGPSPTGVRDKSPAMAWLLSFLLPGGGQWYNGQPGKAAVLGGLAATGSALLLPHFASCFANFGAGCGTTGYERLGYTLMFGSWVVSQVDAPISAARITRKTCAP